MEDENWRDKNWIHYIGYLTKRNYPWVDIDNVYIYCEGYNDSLSVDLMEKLDSHNLFYYDYKGMETYFIDEENENRNCFTDGDREYHEPHSTISLLYNKKYDDENILSHLFKEHKIEDHSTVEEIQIHSLKTSKINLKHLKNCTNLTCLLISDFDLIDIELIPTRNIRELSFRSSRPLSSYIKHIHEMKELVHLSLSIMDETPLIDLTLITTANQKIEYLGISTNYKKINIKKLYKLKNLEMVVFSNIHDIDFHSLYKLEKLKQLVIYSNEEIDNNKLLPLFDKDVYITINNKDLNPWNT